MFALNKILLKIKPSEKEAKRVFKLGNEIINEINKAIYKKKISAEAILGGSGAKRTWLKETHDIDIYVGFNYGKYKNKSDELADILEGALTCTKFKLSRLHGSRDYFQIKSKGYTFEIIPILGVKNLNEIKNITDASLLHVNYIVSFIRENTKLADEIRLAKAFAKTQGCYGAESYIMGFSGYVIELLVVHYGSFEKLLRAASKWGSRTVLGDKTLIAKLNRAKIGPLILLDPVQPNRNAAAALSVEKYKQFIAACRAFLKKPSEDFFTEKTSPGAMKKRGKLLVLNAVPLEGKEDVIGAKLLKLFNFICANLEKYGFNILDKCWYWNIKAKNKAIMWVLVDKKDIQSIRIQTGPPIKLVKHAEAFKKKHTDTFIKNARLFIKKR